MQKGLTTDMNQTILQAKELLIKLAQAIGEHHGGAMSVPDDVAPIILELDSILEKCYHDLSDFLKPQGKNESDHTVAKLLELCCCAYWRARRIRGGGDFCPDCHEHNGAAGLNSGEIRITRPATRLRVIK